MATDALITVQLLTLLRVIAPAIPLPIKELCQKLASLQALYRLLSHMVHAYLAGVYTLSAGASPVEVLFAKQLQSQNVSSTDAQCIAHPVWYVGIFIPLVLVIRCQLYMVHVPQLLQCTCVAKPSERIRTHSLSETAAKDSDISGLERQEPKQQQRNLCHQITYACTQGA